MEQQTLARAFTLEGVGLHTGAFGRITAHPAEPDTGRVFRVGKTSFPARADYVTDTTRCTTLGADGVTLSTVEHLLSALYGCGIDNAILEVEGPEIPILDGSALPFVEAIQAAGIVAQSRPPRLLALTETVEWMEGASQIAAIPDSLFQVEITTEFANWSEGRAILCQTVGPSPPEEYASDIAPARTFAFRHEVEQLLAAGLAKGGSLDNALIITPPDSFSTPLRLPQEWCRHKLLDLLGDLALLDARPQMKLTATRPGHRLNTRLAQELLKDSTRREKGES